MNELLASLRGFTFNGKHNYKDMGVVMHSKSIQPPPKKKIKESVPFMNGSYDFSTVGTNGEITYDERTITIIIGLPAETKEKLQALYSKTIEWLMDSGQCQLIFDDIRDCYYMAEVEEASTFEEVMSFGRLTVNFVAEPFRTSIDYVGYETWDLFNFDEDYMQSVEFDITEIQTVQVYNPGRPVTPIINSSNNMTATINGYSSNLIVGDNIDYKFKMGVGLNNITVEGTGHIKFIFRKESL